MPLTPSPTSHETDHTSWAVTTTGFFFFFFFCKKDFLLFWLLTVMRLQTRRAMYLYTVPTTVLQIKPGLKRRRPSKMHTVSLLPSGGFKHYAPFRGSDIFELIVTNPWVQLCLACLADFILKPLSPARVLRPICHQGFIKHDNYNLCLQVYAAAIA